MNYDQLIALYDELEAAEERVLAEIHAKRALVIALKNQAEGQEETREQQP